MKPAEWLFIAVALIAALLVFSRSSVTQPTSPAPGFLAQTWFNTESPISIEQAQGKVLVIEFWATWCGPCLESLPKLNQLYHEWKDQDVLFVALTDDPPDVVQSFLQQTRLDLPIGAGSTAQRAYGVAGIPHAVVVDGTGMVVWRGHPAEPSFSRAIREAHESLGSLQ